MVVGVRCWAGGGLGVRTLKGQEEPRTVSRGLEGIKALGAGEGCSLCGGRNMFFFVAQWDVYMYAASTMTRSVLCKSGA